MYTYIAHLIRKEPLMRWSH